MKRLLVPALQVTRCCTLTSCTSQTSWHASGFLPVSISSLLVTGMRWRQKLSGEPNRAEPAQACGQAITPSDWEIFGFLLDNSPSARLQGKAASHTRGLIGGMLKEITQSNLLCKHWPLTFTHLNAALHSITPALFLISEFG